jgi:hypothetical protein
MVLAALTFQADTTDHAHAMAMQPMAGQDAAHHSMFQRSFAGGWRVVGMAQIFPIHTAGFAEEASPLDGSGAYLTQGAAMVNLESPGRRFVVRVTPNLEAWTQWDGELNYGGWGEGFLDKRHPHTFLHELMVSVNAWDTRAGSFSLSAGKGFAPYGTDDPMGRPSVKYPTNHHLSQILERFTVNGAWAAGGWGVEAGIFGGSEPEGPYDFSNIESFGDSWSVRLSRRFGARRMGQAALELSASLGRVTHAHGEGHAHGESDGDHLHGDEHGAEEGPTTLVNGAVRYQAPALGARRLYGLIEYSRSEPDGRDGFESLLAEVSGHWGRHNPYARFERATRPEYRRDATAGDGFFRYDHDAEPFAATSWSIVSVGYGFTAITGGVSIRPFVEGQLFAAAGERGGVAASEVLGDRRFGAVTVGARVYLGGDAMRMGPYGIFDSMTRMGR